MDIDIPADDAEVADDSVPRVLAELSLFEWQENEATQSILAVMLPDLEGRSAIIETIESILGDEIEAAKPIHDHDHDHDHNTSQQNLPEGSEQVSLSIEGMT